MVSLEIIDDLLQITETGGQALAGLSVSGGFFNYGIAEFLGCFLILPIFSYLIFAVFDGIGIFRDAFFTSTRSPRIR